MSGSFTGKVALVTGAGKNIGKAIALDLAKDGASVIVNGRADQALINATAAEINAAGGQAIAALADVTKPDEVARMMEAAAARFGGIDIVVSNAGLRRQTAFLDMSFAEWREILSVALDGAFILAKAAVPLMIPRGGGALVFMSGISTHVGTPNRAHVSASKAGLEGLSRALAIDLAQYRITSNCVAPGSVDTVRGPTAGGPAPTSLTDAGIPLRRKATVAEISAAVRYLAGPDGGYVTGQVLHVNGGVFLT